MAVVTTNDLSWTEVTQRIADGVIQKVVELLAKKNEILDDLVWKKSNRDSQEIVTQRLSEPTGSWTGMNEGAARESSRTRQVEEPMGFLESFSRVDWKVVDAAPGEDREIVRATEDNAFINGMNKELLRVLFYGNRGANHKEFTGLSYRPDYDGLSDTYVYGGGGTGSDVASVWIIRWDMMDGCYMVYPKNWGQAGLDYTDMGRQLVTDADGNDMVAYVTHWALSAGFAVKDPKAAFRIANIETAKGAASNTLDDDDLIWAINEMNGNDGSIYVNKNIKSQFDILAKDKTNVDWTRDTVFGRPVTVFQDQHPVRMAEALLITETAIT